jgi:hypothetical protein
LQRVLQSWARAAELSAQSEKVPDMDPTSLHIDGRDSGPAHTGDAQTSAPDQAHANVQDVASLACLHGHGQEPDVCGAVFDQKALPCAGRVSSAADEGLGMGNGACARAADAAPAVGGRFDAAVATDGGAVPVRSETRTPPLLRCSA